MEKAEFIKLAVRCGYCSKKIAEEYAEGKDTLSDDDFIEVYRKEEDMRERHSNDGLHSYGRNGGKTTKSYKVYNNHEG